MSVQCKICKIRPAKIHYTEVVNNSMVTLDLCAECAEEKGIDVQKGSSYGLGDLVAGLIDTAVDSESDKISKVNCPACGYDYSDFKKIGRFGCPECYTAFDAQLLPVLRHVHGSTQHAGKRPPGGDGRLAVRERIARLKDDLQRAVQAENFEAAATLRDEINELESQLQDEQ